MLVSITEVIVSVISSVRKGTILFKTSELERATIALSVTLNLSAGVLAAGFCPVAGKSVGHVRVAFYWRRVLQWKEEAGNLWITFHVCYCFGSWRRPYWLLIMSMAVFV